jgi:serine/threonine-protein kinase HipA
MKLDVHIAGALVGVLEQTDLTDYVFSYAPNTSADKMVSLLMPVRTQSWDSRTLHPAFQVSLPEGANRQRIIGRYLKQVPNFSDMDLLALMGQNMTGRLQISPHASSLQGNATPAQTLRDLLGKTTPELVTYYLDEFLQSNGVSGGFEKFLANSLTEAGSAAYIESDQAAHQRTLIFDHWIVKLDDAKHPYLSLNEYFGLSLAKEMGLPVPRFELSQTMDRLAVERFDIDKDGRQLAFEDMCALQGLGAGHKFMGSIERVIKSIDAFCQPRQAKDAREQFFAQCLANSAIRNGDAHLKNFGLLCWPRCRANAHC